MERARIVLATVFDGVSISAVSRRFETTRVTVRRWVERFRARPGVGTLWDRMRTGRPLVFGCRARAVVITRACQTPAELGRLEGKMTQAIVVEAVQKDGVVVSRSTVQRILARAEVQPHRERYYLFTNKDSPEFAPRRDAICEAYTRTLSPGEVVVCMDEKSGIQALGFIKKIAHGGQSAPAVGGRPRRVDHSYRRHGSSTLVAAVNPATGKLVHSATFRPGKYKTKETIAFLLAILAAFPHAIQIYLVWDNGTTHRSDAMKAFLASKAAERFVFLYTPTHASWLNLAENFFSRFSRRYLHGRRYSSLVDLEKHLAAALVDYERHARPMAWEYDPPKKYAA